MRTKSKGKSDILSLISHELIIPLSILKQEVILMLGGIKDTLLADYQESFIRIKDNVERLKTTVEELLDISRIERGRLELHYSLINLNNLVTVLVNFFKTVAKEKRIRFICNLPKEEVNIFVDPGKVNQIISNLINNAIKFTRAGGMVEIEVKTFDDRVRVGVFDTGIGIAKHNISKMFKKFKQLATPADIRNRGVGLGLFIVKALVLRHGGEVWVESRLGAGSKFYFTLPGVYTPRVLSRDIREHINDSLLKGAHLYLINFLVVRYEEFAKLLRVKSKKLIKDLALLIHSALKRFLRLQKKTINFFVSDFRSGECSVILEEIKAKDAVKLAVLLKEAVCQYLNKQKIKNVFVNVGMLDFSYPLHYAGLKDVPAVISIKKVCVGPEKRHFERFNYQVTIRPHIPRKMVKETQTIDISEGGVCFMTPWPAQINTQFMIRLYLPTHKEPLAILTRVAWISKTEEAHRHYPHKYKMGLEFIHLAKNQRKAISVFIKRIARRIHG